jgi:hypothetical protein
LLNTTLPAPIIATLTIGNCSKTLRNDRVQTTSPCYNRIMPIHDWTRVTAGTFHAFHVAWTAEIQRALNSGVLPDGFYALAEQVAGGTGPDVLTLQSLRGPLLEQGIDIGPAVEDGNRDDPGQGRVAVADAPPRMRSVESIPEATILTIKRRRIVIRHATDDRVIALLEIVSPGNKHGSGPMQSLPDKAVAAIEQGYHLLLIDLFPPGASDPHGIHARLWRELNSTAELPPAGKPLTLAAYCVGNGVTAYVEPVAVGDALTPMPLFLDPAHYVNVPLEETYRRAYEGMPLRWRRVIEGVAPH